MFDATFANDDLDLATLFADADAIGDKYLTDNEIATRNAELLAERVEIWGAIADQDLFDAID